MTILIHDQLVSLLYSVSHNYTLHTGCFMTIVSSLLNQCEPWYWIKYCERKFKQASIISCCCTSCEVRLVMLESPLRRFGLFGFIVWLLISSVFITFFVGEYLSRPESQKSVWKAGLSVSVFRKISWIKKIFSWNLKGIYCIGSVLGTGAGFTTFVFFIGTTIKNNLDDDPHNNQVFLWEGEKL